MRPLAAWVFGVSLVAAVGCGGGSPMGEGDAAGTTTTGNECHRAAGIGASTPGACGALATPAGIAIYCCPCL